MKRTPLERKTRLNPGSGFKRKATPESATDTLRHSEPPRRARTRPRPAPRQRAAYEPGERAWKASHRGRCSVCNAPGRMQRHHVFTEQFVRRHGGDPWDLRNAMDLGFPTIGLQGVCDCHERHTNASKRIPLAKVPADAIDFGVQLLGEDAAWDYLRKYYSTVTQLQEGRDGRSSRAGAF